MNQRQSTRHNERGRRTMRLRSAVLGLVVIALVLGSVAWAQERLGDFVSQAGYDWMVGRWTATTDDGQKLQIVYKWELDKHMVGMDVKMGEYAYRGMIFYSAEEGKVVQVGVDNRGGVSKGEWDEDGDKAVLKLEFRGADGQTGKLAIVHAKVDAKTMKTAMHVVDSDGRLSEEPWATLEYKRTPGKKVRKAKESASGVSR